MFGSAYEDKGPWDSVLLVAKVIYEERENAENDRGGEELADAGKVEGKRRIKRRLSRDFRFERGPEHCG